LLILWDRNNNICIWNIENNKNNELLKTLNYYTGYVYCVSLNYDCSILVSCSADKNICVYDIGLKKLLYSITFHMKYFYSVKFSPNGKNIVSGSWNEKVHIFGSNVGKILLTLRGHT
jgi:WD40 repeat protein